MHVFICHTFSFFCTPAHPTLHLTFATLDELLRLVNTNPMPQEKLWSYSETRIREKLSPCWRTYSWLQQQSTSWWTKSNSGVMQPQTHNHLLMPVGRNCGRNMLQIGNLFTYYNNNNEIFDVTISVLWSPSVDRFLFFSRTLIETSSKNHPSFSLKNTSPKRDYVVSQNEDLLVIMQSFLF